MRIFCQILWGNWLRQIVLEVLECRLIWTVYRIFGGQGCNFTRTHHQDYHPHCFQTRKDCCAHLTRWMYFLMPKSASLCYELRLWAWDSGRKFWYHGPVVRFGFLRRKRLVRALIKSGCEPYHMIQLWWPASPAARISIFESTGEWICCELSAAPGSSPTGEYRHIASQTSFPSWDNPTSRSKSGPCSLLDWH